MKKNVKLNKFYPRKATVETFAYKNNKADDSVIINITKFILNVIGFFASFYIIGIMIIWYLGYTYSLIAKLLILGIFSLFCISFFKNRLAGKYRFFNYFLIISMSGFITVLYFSFCFVSTVLPNIFLVESFENFILSILMMFSIPILYSSYHFKSFLSHTIGLKH